MILLQISSDDALPYFLVAIIVFFICVFITRKIFGIDTIVSHMKYQTELLMKIAKYNKVPHDEIRRVLGLKLAPENKSSDNYDTNLGVLILDQGVEAGIEYVVKSKKLSRDSARDYVSNLIGKQNLNPKKA